MEQFAKPGDYCPNEACSDYRKLQNQSQQNIKRSSTSFYRKRIPEHEILKTLAFLAEGSRISSSSWVKGHKEDTILKWLREAAQQGEQVNEVLMAKFKVQRGQLDALLWAYIRNKGEENYPETDESGQFWRSTISQYSKSSSPVGIQRDHCPPFQMAGVGLTKP
jgi:hypothetical protein